MPKQVSLTRMGSPPTGAKCDSIRTDLVEELAALISLITVDYYFRLTIVTLFICQETAQPRIRVVNLDIVSVGYR